MKIDAGFEAILRFCLSNLNGYSVDIKDCFRYSEIHRGMHTETQTGR
jgi:hypothetical protein